MSENVGKRSESVSIREQRYITVLSLLWLFS